MTKNLRPTISTASVNLQV